MNKLVALMPMQGVQAQGRAIDGAFDTYYKAQGNQRQNALLDIQQAQNERAAQTHEQTLIGQELNNQGAEFQLDQAQGAKLYKALSSLASVKDPEMRAAQIEFMAPGLEKAGFDAEDFEMLSTDEGLQEGIQILSHYASAPTEGKVGLFRQFTGADGKTYKLNTSTGDFEVIAEAQAVDISSLPEEAQEVLKGQPAEVQQKAVESFAQASNIEKRKAAAEQKEKADLVKGEALRITQELLADPDQIRNSVGSFDSILPSVTEGAQDFDKKLDTLKSMLTAENLKLMSGVLSESDIKILSNIGSGELTTKGSEEEFIGALKRLEQKLGGGSGEDDLEGLIQKYAN